MTRQTDDIDDCLLGPLAAAQTGKIQNLYPSPIEKIG